MTRAPADDRHSVGREPYVLATLATLIGLSALSTDVYLPALPSMAKALNAQAGAMELTMSSYLVGVSAGQLLWGPIGDRFGRRGPIACGVTLFLIGCIGCSLSQSVKQVIAWRVIQALGACSGSVLARAIVRDLYQGERAAQVLSTLITIMAVGPLVGPLIGGQLLILASWRAIFWALAATGAIALVALIALPETLPRERRNRQTLGGALVSYGVLLRQRSVMGYAMIGACFYAGFFAFLAGSPFAYIDFYSVPAERYGWLFALAVLGVMATNTLNARFVARLGIDRSLRIGGCGAAAAGIAVVVSAATGWGALIGLVAPLVIFVSMNGFIVANTVVGALQPFPQRAGAVSALVGTVQFGGGILGSMLLSRWSDGTPLPMACVIAITGVGTAACALFLPRRA